MVALRESCHDLHLALNVSHAPSMLRVQANLIPISKSGKYRTLEGQQCRLFQDIQDKHVRLEQNGGKREDGERRITENRALETEQYHPMIEKIAPYNET